MTLSTDEQAAVDQASHDGEGWALVPGASAAILETLATKGLIRLARDRWQLTPAGFARSAMFR